MPNLRYRAAAAALFGSGRRPIAVPRRMLRRLTGNPRAHELSQRLTMEQSAENALRLLLGEDALYEQRAGGSGGGTGPRRYPDFYEVADNLDDFLYSAVLHLRPDTVFEVGVADGRSSATILDALERNRHGRLVSVDISADVGSLVTRRSRWDLRILDPKATATQITDLLVDVGQRIDVYLDDGPHDYRGQMMHYLAGLRALRPGGLFVSDDIDCSFAFLDLVDEVQPASLVALTGPTKTAGAFVKP